MPKDHLLRFLGRGSLGYALRFIKSVVKVAIGRKPHFYPQDLFFLAYLRQLLKLSRACITCKLTDYSGEGGGSHAISMMTVIDFARSLDLDYVHTPFIEIHHADRPREDWLAAWEKLFNFGAGEVRADSTNHEIFAITSSNFDSIRALFGKLCPYNEYDTLLIPQFSPSVVEEFRRKYYSNKSPRQNDKLSVCVHVRRFNSGDENTAYIASFARVAQTLADVRAVLEARHREYVVRIFSQGHISEFPHALQTGAEFHLDADPIWSMEELIESDVLISSRGSFSYAAGVYCDGIVICEPFFPPQRDWLICDPEGKFDTDVLARRLLVQEEQSALRSPNVL